MAGVSAARVPAYESESEEPKWRATRRARILAAAAGLLRGGDLTALNMDDVAAEAGIGKATLYRYFPSKDTLLFAVFDAGLGALADRLRDCAVIEDPLERLLAMTDEITAVTGGQLACLRLVTGQQQALTNQWRLVFRRHRAAIVGALRGALADGVAAGRLRPFDLDVLPTMIVGMVRGGLAPSLTESGPTAESRDRVGTTLRAFLTAALAVEPDEPVAARRCVGRSVEEVES